MTFRPDFLDIAQRYVSPQPPTLTNAERKGEYDPPLSPEEERLVYGEETCESRRTGGKR